MSRLPPANNRLQTLKTCERCELLDRRALGDEPVFDGIGIGVSQRQAANEDLTLRNAEQRPDQRMEIGKRRLRAGIEPAPARSDGETADKDSKIEPAADFKVFIECKHHAHRRSEKLVISPALALGALEVPFVYAEQAVQVPANLAPAAKKRLAPVDRIVVPLAPVLFEAVAIDCIEDPLRQLRSRRSG